MDGEEGKIRDESKYQARVIPVPLFSSGNKIVLSL
jgi:hypothetical protein